MRGEQTFHSRKELMKNKKVMVYVGDKTLILKWSNEIMAGIFGTTYERC